MTLLPLLILALIQGLTEFLPISSSAHLLLAHTMLDGESGAASWADDLMLDIAVHVGTLFAVMLYFRADMRHMIAGGVDMLRGRGGSGEARLLRLVVLASIPVILAGFVLFSLKPEWLRSVEIIGWTTLIFGIILWVVDDKIPAERSFETLRLRDAIIIGCAQVLALVPGVSRSGITMTAGRCTGLSREASARFSLLLSIIAIAGAGAIGGFELLKSGDARLGIDILIAGILAFAAGLAAIAVMMAWLKHAGFRPFAIYRIIMGIGLLYAVYAGYLPRSFYG